MKRLIFFTILLLFSLPCVAEGSEELNLKELKELGLDISDSDLRLNQRGESLALPSQDFFGQVGQPWNSPLPLNPPATKSKGKG